MKKKGLGIEAGQWGGHIPSLLLAGDACGSHGAANCTFEVKNAPLRFSFSCACGFFLVFCVVSDFLSLASGFVLARLWAGGERLPTPKTPLGTAGGLCGVHWGAGGSHVRRTKRVARCVVLLFFIIIIIDFLSSSPPRPCGRRLGLRAAPRLSSPPSCPARRVGPHAGTPGRTTRGNLCCPGGRTRFFSPIRAVRA